MLHPAGTRARLIDSAVRGASSNEDPSAPDHAKGSWLALEELDLGDPLMARNIRAAKRVTSRDIPVVLIGETGTGKELFARALHAASENAGQPFVAVNCASIPGTLIESELLGYRHGGMTAAPAESKQGRIVQAHGGTLFLDEIDELPYALHGRLLHLLEEREVIALGSETPIKVDVRLVCATRCNLEDKVRRGEFREDLFYRLQGLVLTLPRFHEREDKRALLRRVFAQEAAGSPSVSLSEELIDALCASRWPGNIRQLRNALRAMIARRSGDRLEVADLPGDYGLGPRPVEPAPPAPEKDSLNALARAERDALLRELELEHGNLSHVAHKLDVSRNTLYRKIHRLGIKWPVKKPLH